MNVSSIPIEWTALEYECAVEWLAPPDRPETALEPQIQPLTLVLVIPNATRQHPANLFSHTLCRRNDGKALLAHNAPELSMA